jgi:predicted nucleic acid-binding protein
LYTLDNSSPKQEKAFSIWRSGIVVSTQVVMEFTNICLRKMKFSKKEAFENANNIMEGALVRPIDKSSVSLAFDISIKYGFSHWDSLIVASALEAKCHTLYSEDLQHGQLINGKMKIINPFSAQI